jgi:integrase
MSLFRYKGSKVWTMDFVFQGQRIRESTKTQDLASARTIQRKRQTDLENGSAGIKKIKKGQFFGTVAEEYIEKEKASLRPNQKGGHASTVRIDEFNLEHLLPVFKTRLLVDIAPVDIAKYQQKRLRDGAAPKTVNLELGTFRSIAAESGLWARLVPKIKMLEVEDDIGIELTPEQQQALLEACSLSDSRLLYPMVMLALETGARSGTIKRLTWGKVDFLGRGLRWGKDKTKAGTGRTIPISNRAMAALEVWAANFPNRKPTHFVFPSETYQQPKDGDSEGSPYTTHPMIAVTSVERSWRTAKAKAAWILAGRPDSMEHIEPLECRFHDLRHTAVTRMIQAKIPIPIIAQLVGWSTSTMVAMSARYGHYSMDTLRMAVETISSGESLVRSPVLDESGKLPRKLTN